MSSSKLCVLVKQQYHYLHWWEKQHNLHRHRVLTVSVPCTPSPTWLKCRCFQLSPRPTLERHLGRLGVRVTNQPTGCCRGAPPRFVDCPGPMCVAPWAHRDQCRFTMVSRMCSVTMVALGSLYPFGTGGYPACYHCGGGVGPMWWHWVTWCGCPAIPGDAVGVFPLVAPRLPLVAW